MFDRWISWATEHRTHGWFFKCEHRAGAAAAPQKLSTPGRKPRGLHTIYQGCSRKTEWTQGQSEATFVRVHAKSLSPVQLFAAPWTVARQAPLS